MKTNQGFGALILGKIPLVAAMLCGCGFNPATCKDSATDDSAEDRAVLEPGTLITKDESQYECVCAGRMYDTSACCKGCPFGKEVFCVHYQGDGTNTCDKNDSSGSGDSTGGSEEEPNTQCNTVNDYLTATISPGLHAKNPALVPHVDEDVEYSWGWFNPHPDPLPKADDLERQKRLPGPVTLQGAKQDSDMPSASEDVGWDEDIGPCDNPEAEGTLAFGDTGFYDIKIVNLPLVSEDGEAMTTTQIF